MPDPVQDTCYARLPSRGVVRVSGPEAHDFLQGLVTNDMDKAEKAAIYAALLTPQGKILFDFFILQSSEGYLLDCHGDDAPDLTKRLSMYRLRAKVEIADESDLWTCFAVFGPEADQLSGTHADPRLAALGRRGLFIGSESVPEHSKIQSVSEEDYLTFCLSMGIANIPKDAGRDKTFLLEANFDELNGVDFTKGCYVGQELAARMKHRAKVRKRLLPIEIDGALPETGTPVLAGEREIGSLRSGIGNRAIALIRIDRLDEAGDAPLTAGGCSLQVNWPVWLAR